VPSFGAASPELLIVGLAPGLRGANRTGRPFTGDDAGDFLFAALARAGLTGGTFDRRADDGFRLNGTMILNAVKCWPPQNKPTFDEIATCRRFLDAQLAALPSARVLLALGRIAHDSLLRRYDLRLAAHPFAHAAGHRLPDGRLLLDSYHCSRQNTRTGRLTPAMFAAVIERAKGLSNKMPARAP
jgi:uracil-DNA glycosylase family 4